jgi:hypothetical protein
LPSQFLEGAAEWLTCDDTQVHRFRREGSTKSDSRALVGRLDKVMNPRLQLNRIPVHRRHGLLEVVDSITPSKWSSATHHSTQGQSEKSAGPAAQPTTIDP